MNIKVFEALVAALLLGVSSAAAAHTGQEHASHAAQADREQTDWGIAGDAKAARRTIRIEMSDAMRFTPDRIQVKQGETVKLVVHNAGRVLHELVIGTKDKLDEHAAMMVKFPTMQHDEPYMTHVAPGKTGVIVWNFNRAGKFDFACLIPGHYQAGMKGRIVVAPARAQPR